MNINQTRTNDQTRSVDLLRLGFRLFADPVISNQQIADLVAAVRRINDASVANQGAHGVAIPAQR